MTNPDPGRVLRRALLGWGLGHLALGLATAGWSLLATEIVAVALVAWLTIGLIDTSAYLVPYLAGVLFLVAWAWQAVDAHRIARRPDAARPPREAGSARSPVLAMSWLSIPLLAWGSGFWLFAAEAATPSATLDRFVTAWEADALEGDAWGERIVDAADAASDRLGDEDDRFRDVRVRIVEHGPASAVAVAEAVHYERRPSRFLGIFAGAELVPVADEVLLRLELRTTEAGLPGGGGIGAVRWAITDAEVDP